jgi:hypothetical protein
MVVAIMCILAAVYSFLGYICYKEFQRHSREEKKDKGR